MIRHIKLVNKASPWERDYQILFQTHVVASIRGGGEALAGPEGLRRGGT